MFQRRIDIGYVVRLQRGEDVVSTLTRFAEDIELRSGFVTGIGAVSDPELGFFDFDSKEYVTRKLRGEYELISLTGNFAMVDGRPFLHAHAVVADRNCSPSAGHLCFAEVAVTGEFLVTPSAVKISREPDDQTGLNLLKL